MLHNQAEKTKQAPRVDRPFPWRCRHCGKQEVVMATTEYEAEVRHDGRLHAFTVPNLKLPVCQACGERLFTDEADDQIDAALLAHLNLLTPDQIRDCIKRVGMSQREAAKRLGIAEATLSRWLNEVQIQSRAMDNLLRAFFAFPQLRAALCGETQDRQLGLSDDACAGDSSDPKNESEVQDRSTTGAPRPDEWMGRREQYRQTERHLRAKVHDIIPHEFFSATSAECKEMYVTGCFYGCITLCQSVAEGLSKFLAEKNNVRVRSGFTARVGRLKQEGVISDTAADAFRAVHSDDRDAFHHLNNDVEQDHGKLERRALECLDALYTVESEVFAYDLHEGRIKPKHEKYWPKEGEDSLLVNVRFD